MSVTASAWAWDQHTRSSAQRLVLLALADAADDDGYCWPSVARLAAKCALSDRQVRDHITALEVAGLLVRQRRRRSDGTLGSYDYWLSLGVAPLPREHHRRDSACGGKGSPPPAVHRRTEPSVEPGVCVEPQPQPSLQEQEQPREPSPGSVEPVPLLPSRRPADFTAWYAMYPRKTARKAAVRAWDVAARSGSLPSLDVLLAAVSAYRTTDEVRRGFIAHPATWLNQGRWADHEDLAAPRMRPRPAPDPYSLLGRPFDGDPL